MLKEVDFTAADYGQEVAAILALDGDGLRPMPLAPKSCSNPEARERLKGLRTSQLFGDALCPEGAMAGLYLYFSCLDEAHAIAQDLGTAEGSYWHGIMHRQEPDAWNAGYWMRQVGKHPIFAALRDEAKRLRFDSGHEWNPMEFIEFCEAARVRPGSDEEWIAQTVQLAEWQMLFDYCARGEKKS
jgi:hypothetical protein